VGVRKKREKGKGRKQPIVWGKKEDRTHSTEKKTGDRAIRHCREKKTIRPTRASPCSNGKGSNKKFKERNQKD